MNNSVFDNLDFEDKNKLNEILNREEIEFVERYVSELENELHSVEEERDDLEDRCADLENDLQEEREYNVYKEFLNSVIEDRYLHVHRDYDTLEKLLDKIEFVAKYGEF